MLFFNANFICYYFYPTKKREEPFLYGFLYSPSQTGKNALDLALEGKVRRIPVDSSGSNTNVS